MIPSGFPQAKKYGGFMVMEYYIHNIYFQQPFHWLTFIKYDIVQVNISQSSQHIFFDTTYVQTYQEYWKDITAYINCMPTFPFLKL